METQVEHEGCTFFDETNDGKLLCCWYDEDRNIGDPLFFCPQLPWNVQFGYIEFMLFEVLPEWLAEEEECAA